ncbi:hypothetical protein F2P56_021707 [Juglans regia]|uniref:Uncharacterized protein n=1 Tax=Juglans regia TaxID=51240 RepID=A0A833UP85_JUGRE|nr:hypothetical protein F2P56_021707 [Juglans regia]
MVGETANKLSYFLLVTVLMMMIFLPHTTRWGVTASSIQLDNGTRTALDYQGRMEEPELLFDSEISRMLIQKYVTPGTANPRKPPVSNCGGRTPNYRTCLPKAIKSDKRCLRRGTYSRC